MTFVEIFAFSNTGQNIAASALGAVAAIPTSVATGNPAFGNDMFADPASASAGGMEANGNCLTTGATTDSWTLNFPPAPGYPLGYPTPVSSVYYVNRLDPCCVSRVNNSQSVIYLYSPNGTAVAQRAITTGATVTSFFFNDAQTGPIMPDPTSAFQVSAANQAAYVRYVRIAAAPNKCLHFREVFVFDHTLTNVALFKNASSSVGVSYTDATNGFLSFPSYGVDGIVDVSLAFLLVSTAVNT